MTKVQTSSLLTGLHSIPKSDRDAWLESALPAFGTSSADAADLKALVLQLFVNGIGKLNNQQLRNLIEEWVLNPNSQRIMDKLNYYGVEERCRQNIISYLEGYQIAATPLNVSDMDTSFEGLQVATRDSFHKLLTDGYSGVWIVNPEKVRPLRLQIASMNDAGPYPRGWYIQADIVSFEEVDYGGQKRYRIHFNNPVVVNSGYRNIKFGQQPVTYIRR